MWTIGWASVAQAAWVLQSDRDRRLGRALRLLQRHEIDITTVVGPSAVCVDAIAPASLLPRVASRLGSALEERVDCHAARFPPGHTWIGLVIRPPADRLQEALSTSTLPAHELRWTVDGVAQLCVTAAALPDPMGLVAHLADHGIVPLGPYDVGGCGR